MARNTFGGSGNADNLMHGLGVFSVYFITLIPTWLVMVISPEVGFIMLFVTIVLTAKALEWLNK